MASIRDLARKAGMAEAKGEPWDDEKLDRKYCSFTSWPPGRSRHSRPPPAEQQGDTPERQREAQADWESSEEHQRLVDEAEEAGF